MELLGHHYFFFPFPYSNKSKEDRTLPTLLAHPFLSILQFYSLGDFTLNISIFQFTFIYSFEIGISEPRKGQKTEFL